MSVSNTVVKAIYATNGITDTFAIPFAGISGDYANEVKVYEVDLETGIKTLLTTGYSLVPTPDPGPPIVNPTNVVFDDPPDEVKIMVIREMPLTQIVELLTTGAFDRKVVEKGLDRLLLMLQEIEDRVDRAMQINLLDIGVVDGYMPPAVAKAVLARNEANDGWEWVVTDDFEGAPGQDGADGADGTQIYVEANVPSDLTGVNGDLFIDTLNDYNLYRKVGGTWTLLDSLVGPQGPAGANGTNGTNGTNGSNGADGADGTQITIGSGAPDNGDGVDGDFYIDDADDFELYHKESGVWVAQGSLKGDTGPAGADGAAGSGAGTPEWYESANSPEKIFESGLEVYHFIPAGAQELYTAIRVPASYSAGDPIHMNILALSVAGSGTILLRAEATLIRSEVDAFTSTTNKRTTTNSAITMDASNDFEPQKISLDLSSSIGQINTVDISAGDLIKVRLYRDTDTATENIKFIPTGTEVLFV